jgi:hypothetical protein
MLRATTPFLSSKNTWPSVAGDCFAVNAATSLKSRLRTCVVFPQLGLNHMQVLTYQQKEPTGETSLSTKCKKLGQSARHRPPQRSDSHCILLLAESPNAATNTSERRFLEAAPDRAIWGTDWPHTHYQGTMPNDADLLELLYRFAPDLETQTNILVRNPERLFDRLRQ